MTKILVTKRKDKRTAAPAPDDFPPSCPVCGTRWEYFTGAFGCRRAFCGNCKGQCYEMLEEPYATESGPNRIVSVSYE